MYFQSSKFAVLQSFKYLICLLILSCSWIMPSTIFAHGIPTILHWQTDQGAQVYFVRTIEHPIVDIQLAVRAGSAYDGPHYGLAALTIDMLDEGTADLNADQIAAEFDRVGAQYNSGIDYDMATISLRSLSDPKFLNPAITLFKKIINAPTFPASAFSRDQQQLLGSIAQQSQDPTSISINAFYHLLYGDGPYGHPLYGTQEAVKQITLTNVKQFYQQYFTAQNAVLVIVGDLTEQEAKALASSLISLPAGSLTPLPASLHIKALKELRTIPFPSQQTAIVLGQLGIDYNDPHFFPLLVGNWIVGGMPLSSILFEEVRNKKGLAYNVQSTFNQLAGRGPFLATMRTRRDKAQEALDITEKSLTQFIAEGPTEEQLRAAKENLIGGFPLKIDSNKEVVSNVTIIGFYHLPLDYLSTYQKNVAAVTIDQIKRAMQATLNPEKFNIVMVGSKK